MTAWRAWRFLGAAHVAGVLIFIGMMASFLWYVHAIEREEQRSALLRDTDWAQQSIKLSLRELQDQLSRLAPLWQMQAGGFASALGPGQSQTDFMQRFPQARYVGLVDAEGKLQSVSLAEGSLIGNALEAGEVGHHGNSILLHGFHRMPPESGRRATYEGALKSWQLQYSPPLLIPGGEVVTELYQPVMQGRNLIGTVVIGIALDRLLEARIPANSRARYRFSILDDNGMPLASLSSNHKIDARAAHELPLEPHDGSLTLSAVGYVDEQPGLADRLTLLGLLTLSATSILSLLLLWRSARDRLRIESERDRLFLLSQDVFCVIRPDGTLVRGNPAFVDYFGTDTTNTRFWDHVYPDDRLDVIEAFTATDGSERIGPLECRVRFRNAWRWLSWSISIDHRSAESLYYAVAHDITARKHVEHALTTEATFRRAIEDSISTGMRVIDHDGRITYVNRALCEILGFEAEELVGQLPPYPYWIPEEYDLNITHLNLTISGSAPPSGIQTRARRKDGRIIDVRLYVSPLIDDQGQQAGWMASVTDITEPNRIRDELVNAHERFNTVLNELDAAVSVASLPPPLSEPSFPGTAIDADTALRPAAAPSPVPPTLLFSNFRYRATFGEDIAGHQALLKGWPVADSWIGEEVHVPSIDRWFEVRVQQIRWVDGKEAQLVVATDITALRPVWEQQKQQQEQLAQTSRLVTMGEMASSIAHELNQPLAAISNYAMGLAKRLQMPQQAGNSPDMVNETLVKIAKQAQRAASVIQRVRDFVRRNSSERRLVTVNAILSEALGLAEIAAKRHGVNISINLQQTLPPLHADRILVEQVLLNLLKNAIDAMRDIPHPALTLRISANEHFVEFAVADQGPGLPPELRDRVFEPFFTTKSEGMGMGLNICRTIIESHGGRLWVEANEPQGCIFKFTLPAKRPDSPIIAPS